MSRLFIPFSRRSLIALSFSVCLVALTAGFLVGMPDAVPSAHAALCQAYNGVCIHQYRTAAVDVTHVVPGESSDTPVEPDDGESWNVTAYWNTNWLPCHETSETATFDVSFDDATGWTISNESLTTNIIDIEICTIGNDCAQQYTHSYGYRL